MCQCTPNLRTPWCGKFIRHEFENRSNVQRSVYCTPDGLAPSATNGLAVEPSKPMRETKINRPELIVVLEDIRDALRNIAARMR